MKTKLLIGLCILILLSGCSKFNHDKHVCIFWEGIDGNYYAREDGWEQDTTYPYYPKEGVYLIRNIENFPHTHFAKCVEWEKIKKYYFPKDLDDVIQ